MILFRYLAREVAISMLAVSFTLLVIVMSGRLAKYLAQAASGDLDPGILLEVMLYRVPSFLELVLPLGLFIGILLAYGRLYVESEMTVMSACGISTRKLASYTLIPSLLVAVLVGYISLVASPSGISKVRQVLDQSESTTGLETLIAGQFRIDDKSGRVTYVESFSDDHHTMNDVFSAGATSADGGSHELVVMLAERGFIELDQTREGRYLVLEEGYRYSGEPGGQAFEKTAFSRLGQRISDPAAKQSHIYKTDARTTKELMASNRLQDKATLQWRISLALLVPVIAMIAQALSRTDHRRGRYVKMLPAFLIYIFYVVLLSAARDAIEKEKLSADYGMLWVHLLFALLALILLFGSDGLRWWRNRGQEAL